MRYTHIFIRVTTVSVTVLTQRNSVADFLPEKCNFKQKTAVLRLQVPFGGGAQKQRQGRSQGASCHGPNCRLSGFFREKAGCVGT